MKKRMAPAQTVRRKRLARGRKDDWMYSVVIAVVMLLAVFLLVKDIGTGSPIELSGNATMENLSGSYSGHYNEVPESNIPDFNGNIFLNIGDGNEVIVTATTNSGKEAEGLVGTLNGTEILTILPSNGTVHHTCTLTGTRSDVTDSANEQIVGFAGTVICSGEDPETGSQVTNTFRWTVSRAS